ncbi:hypothetical protein A3E73_00880 [Candidatus Beckwithbacteria bacterium RIFCSPHIGHO2_12_FULL_47_17]|uniref:Uncharacterized protein n=1 Tax=Candidatus Beckwithbacteria bacterium RIFCSPHIGHO2_12_FULL_47_17 TaxID=1797460 RepID=A0A1F5DM20_9BACT|nr:MAG: hypothetical protein A3E73_00880 [Candidatus Beckwithbacteria bacterium RIFCSPHIGHO2_12_FULL_47_17]
MSIKVNNERFFITDVEVTGSQSAVSGWKAQQIAEFLWPDFSNESLEEELKPRVDSLQSGLKLWGVTAEMLQDTINYLVTAKTKHSKSPKVNPMHIHLAVDLLRTTRDQMFPEQS